MLIPRALTPPAAALVTTTAQKAASEPPASQAPARDELIATSEAPKASDHACQLPPGLYPARPSTPELVARAGACSTDPATEDGRATCLLHDARKIAWARDLTTAIDKPAAARRLAAMTEALHGKPGQTRATMQFLRKLLDDGRVQALLGASVPLVDRADIELAAAFLNLGEVEAPSAHYLTQGRPSDEARKSFAGRPERAAQFVAAYGLAGTHVQQLLQQFHSDVPGDRPIAAQLLDVSERAAAMTAARPGRAGMPTAKVTAILAGEAARGVFDARLVDVANAQIEAVQAVPKVLPHG